MDDFKELLEWKILHNTVGDYLLAALIFVSVWMLLIFGRKLLIRQLFRLENRYSVTGLRFINRLLGSVHVIFFLWLSLYFALQQLSLSHRLAIWTDKLAACVVILQATSLAALAMSLLINQLKLGDPRSDVAQNSVKQNLTVLLKTAVWVGGLLFLLSNLGINVSTFITGLGVGGIAVALAAQTILGDTFSSFSITIDKPFEVGDEIMVDSVRGIVESIGLKTTRVRSPTGEMIVFSNSDLTKARVYNFHQQEERIITIKIGLEYDTPTERLEALSGEFSQLLTQIPQAQFIRSHFMQFGESALIYDLVYCIKKADFISAPEIQHHINLAIKKHLEKSKIGMAFPTQTVHLKKV